MPTISAQLIEQLQESYLFKKYYPDPWGMIELDSLDQTKEMILDKISYIKINDPNDACYFIREYDATMTKTIDLCRDLIIAVRSVNSCLLASELLYSLLVEELEACENLIMLPF
jgi:hypothetical protein